MVKGLQCYSATVLNGSMVTVLNGSMVTVLKAFSFYTIYQFLKHSVPQLLTFQEFKNFGCEQFRLLCVQPVTGFRNCNDL